MGGFEFGWIGTGILIIIFLLRDILDTLKDISKELKK